MSLSLKIIAALFWVAFIAFLAVSIPHLAYVFRAYEPMNDPYDQEWWFIAYGAAVSIDVMIALLSYVAGSLQRKKQDKHVIAIVWAFILVLMSISWFCNWAFAIEHRSSWLGAVVSMPILFGKTTVGTVMPLLVSAIPVFVIAYTYVSDKIIQEKPKSAEELTKEADELELIAHQKQRIAELKVAQNTSSVKRLFGTAREVLGEVKQFSLRQQVETPNGALPAVPEEHPLEVPDEKKEEPIGIPNGTPLETFVEEDSPEIGVATVPPNTIPLHSGGQTTMTIEEAATYLGYSVKWVKTLRDNGKLKKSSRNADRLLTTSVKEWGDQHPKREKSKDTSGTIPALKIVQNS